MRGEWLQHGRQHNERRNEVKKQTRNLATSGQDESHWWSHLCIQTVVNPSSGSSWAPVCGGARQNIADTPPRPRGHRPCWTRAT